MTKEDVFISVGFVDKTNPKKYDPIRRYFLSLHDKDLTEIMNYLARKAKKFDPMKDFGGKKN